MNKIQTNKYFYFGDINPECGGVIYTKLENGSIEAYEIGEFNPINFCNYLCRLIVNEDYETHEELQNAFYNGEIVMESYTDFKFMKSIDWEYTNEVKKDCIDKFVRYDYNVWNVIKSYIGIKKTAKIFNCDGV